ncbi:MAG: hypothetical protein GF398_07700 [Chitinivibrionales bacterium]|nr:hypothetical protein [Chitinivibrionales bacterium]
MPGDPPMNKQKGITAIELITAIAIAGILTAVGWPVFNHMVARRQVVNGVNVVKSTLDVANSRAIANPRVHCGVYFDVDAKPPRMTVFFDDIYNNKYDPGYDRVYLNPVSLDNNVSISIVDMPDDVAIYRGDGSLKYGVKFKIKHNAYANEKTIEIAKSTGSISVE